MLKETVGEPEIAGDTELDYCRRLTDQLQVGNEYIRQAQANSGVLQKRAYDTHCGGHAFVPGDKLGMFCPVRTKGISLKLHSDWQGPGKILGQITEVVYKVRKLVPELHFRCRIFSQSLHNARVQAAASPPDLRVLSEPVTADWAGTVPSPLTDGACYLHRYLIFITTLREDRRLVYLTSDWVYHLVNDSLAFSEADSFCRGQFSSLISFGKPEDQDGALELHRKVGLHLPIWVKDPGQAASKPLALAKQYAQFSALNFPRESHQGFAHVNISFPTLSAVSVCVRVQWDPMWDEVSTIFSYAAPVFTNEFQLRGQVDKMGRILLALIIHGQHRPYKASFPNDGAWHHLCVTWRKTDGHWAIYVDGERRDMGSGADTPRDIYGEGIFILGQDQDSFGGNFTEPFVGNITDLNVWNVSIERGQLRALNACSLLSQDLLFRWDTNRISSHPAVKEGATMLFCPAVHQQRALQGCRMLEDWSQELRPSYGLSDCSEPRTFICRTSRERYLKIKEMHEARSSRPSPFLNHLMKRSNKSQGVLGEELSGQMSWGQVSALLNMSKQALEDTQQGEGLHPEDMLSLIQLLSMAADVPADKPADGNRSQASAEELSQHFISVADSLISQNNTLKWQAIKEVVSGPMDVVKSIDRMVTSLSPRLMAETDHLLIYSPNIKLEVQQLTVEKGSSGSDFCGPQTEKDSIRDCISVPHQKIQDLHNNGFSTLTLVSMWYGSLRPLVSSGENITTVPTVTDGSQRYLGTILGSSIISTIVLGDDQPVSMPVRFQLQHSGQNPSSTVYDPVCAFWDFDLTPEAGGYWSARGCEVVSSQYGSTFCHCNHTTNFALLMQVYEGQRSQENEKALQVLTFIGCGVSLCGLLFTFILFVAVGVPKSDRTTVHKNLIVALGTAELLLMCSDWASANEGTCLAVTALLHLFFMASFSWMLVEGLLLWSKVVSVNISEDRRMRLYYVIGWGLPVLIVGVTLAISLDKYKADNHCWLNAANDMIWAFVGPVLFVLAVNAVVLCRVVIVTVSSARRRAKMLTPSSASKMHTFDLTWAVTRPVLILLPVLGLTWLCGVLVHLSMIIAYVFIALNAFQGLYIFLVYAVYNSEVRNAIKRIKEKRKALSFTNCSQPISFLPSQRASAGSWGHSLHTPSSPETSETSGPPSSTSNSLVIKNESFRKESFVTFSLKPALENQVVQLTAFKPSGIVTPSCLCCGHVILLVCVVAT
ncbi:adhesion G-protein coupled receptor D2 [Lampris incognitus]|uniref:adhesion G-protein coupled receptor D2 n=1 Tax=Lampris incognitus TaxID=2546036 RepID=UPI0024B5D26C|nr:adhesion G-protein coupled receptor D2 [Lampris incognitus]